STHIAWRDNQGRTGYIPQNTYHTQSYFPEWIDADSITFSGTCLPNNAVDERGDGSYYVLYCYDYGYADNFPNNDDRSNMKIDWAVDAEGKPVELPGIHFVKVYTGLNQVAGWLGETSTEVMGAEDLHVAAALPVLQTPKMSVIACTSDNRLTLTSDCTRRLTIYTVTGQPVMHVQIEAGTSTIHFSAPSGMYIIRSDDDTIRFVKP
ncbi:MAG: T9SS type A sorting domain-containing protein, partial [Paludibacteraceae bacterium]|nr:T9SS type A sorting domain-containing protein [Paludibacteraceae bacterium]